MIHEPGATDSLSLDRLDTEAQHGAVRCYLTLRDRIMFARSAVFNNSYIVAACSLETRSGGIWRNKDSEMATFGS